MEDSVVITQELLVRITAYYCVLVHINVYGCELGSALVRLSKTQKLKDNQKLTHSQKSPSSKAGIPRFRFLVANSLIKDQKSTLEMAIWAFWENFINEDLHFCTQHGHPPWPEFGMHLPTISQRFFHA